MKQKILRANGIKTRHYALNQNQQSTYQCSELAAQAGLHCLNNAFADSADVDLLAVGSTQGDLPLPGLASMVQAELDIPACEIISTHGVCSSGVMALKAAANQVKLGEKRTALVCASELSSRLLKKSRYEAAKHESLDLEAEFLRWMLSDGAGAFLVEPQPSTPWYQFAHRLDRTTLVCVRFRSVHVVRYSGPESMGNGALLTNRCSNTVYR